MGFWSKLAGIALGVTGAVTGQPGLIAAGGQVIGADVAKEGAEKAADQQVAAADKANAEANALYNDTRNEQRRVFENSNAAFQPYISLGQGTLPTLGSMVGMKFEPTPYTPQQAPAQTATTPVVPQSAAPVTTPQSLAMQQSQLQTQSSYENKRGIPGEGRPRMGLGELGGRGMVLVASPDGAEQRFLPRRLADRAIASGAREIG